MDVVRLVFLFRMTMFYVFFISNMGLRPEDPPYGELRVRIFATTLRTHIYFPNGFRCEKDRDMHWRHLRGARDPPPVADARVRGVEGSRNMARRVPGVAAWARA